MKFRSCDGIEMEVGKNALQNERLTMGARGNRNMAARAEDAGFACADSHGGRRAGVYALMQAAMLAAYYSKGVRSAQVPIDATLRRYIKKPGGTPPVFVTQPTRERCISPRAKRKSKN